MYRMLVIPALLLLSGCGSIIGPTACTLIGCESGLEVLFDGAQTEPVRVEAEVPGRPGRFVLECDGTNRCRGGVFFADFTPDAVRIRIVSAAGTTEQLYRPTYTERRPNGPNCEPLCRTARVTAVLPSRV